MLIAKDSAHLDEGRFFTRSGRCVITFVACIAAAATIYGVTQLAAKDLTDRQIARKTDQEHPPDVVRLFTRVAQEARVSCPGASCECSWISQPGSCAPQANDGNYCWSCCCEHNGQTYGNADESSFNMYHNYDRLPVGPGDLAHGRLNGQSYHYYRHFNDGDSAYAKVGGKYVPVTVKTSIGNGNYEVLYPSGVNPVSNQVSAYDLSAPPPTGVSIWVWVFILFILLLAAAYAMPRQPGQAW